MYMYVCVRTCTCTYTSIVYTRMYYTCMYSASTAVQSGDVLCTCWGQTSQRSLDSGYFKLVSFHQQGMRLTYLTCYPALHTQGEL